MKKAQIIGLIAVVALFVARVYNAKQQEKNRKAQQNMIRDLARQQLEERAQQKEAYYNDHVKEIADSMRAALEESRRKLDSTGLILEENLKKFKESMAETN